MKVFNRSIETCLAKLGVSGGIPLTILFRIYFIDIEDLNIAVDFITGVSNENLTFFGKTLVLHSNFNKGVSNESLTNNDQSSSQGEKSFIGYRTKIS